MTRRRRLALGGGVLVALTAGIVPALAANRGPTLTPSFTTPLALGKWSGGEPSLAFDPNNPRNLYITAPQSVPAAVNGPLADGSGSQGVGFWASYDGGRTFPNAQNIGSGTGGGDSDVTVGPDGTVYVADLEATAADICVSTDHGHTFTSGNAAKSVDKCGTATTNQQGPEDDRQWLTASSAQDNAIYLTYHDFAAGYPIIERSTDHAATFAPCGQILNATSAAGQNYTATNGTLVAKPTIDRDGRMFVEVTEPPVVSPPVGAALSNLYIAVAPKGCQPGTIFNDYTIYTNPTADLAKIFDGVATDGAGNVYVISAGITHAGELATNVWLFVSHDHGVHWSAPTRVNTPNLKANVMPAIAGGRGPNEVAIGWFGTSTNGDPNYQKDQWRYYVATSFDGGRSFHQTTVTRDPIHYGDICTQGLFCGLVPGQPSNRNLADFDTVVVDPSGAVLVAFPGDPYNRPDLPNGKNTFSSTAYFVRQAGGRLLK